MDNGFGLSSVCVLVWCSHFHLRQDLFIISIFLQLKETAQLYIYNSLLQANINVRAIAQGCSEFNITVVVKREDCIKALKAVHSRFYLSRTTIAVGIIGPGLIGSTLLEQLKDQVLFFFFLGGDISSCF